MFDWIKDFLESHFANNTKAVVFAIIVITVIIGVAVFLTIKVKKYCDKFFDSKKLKEEIEECKDKIASLEQENVNLKKMLQDELNEFDNNNPPYQASEYEAIKEFLNT